jgi:hypothetical protein
MEGLHPIESISLLALWLIQKNIFAPITIQPQVTNPDKDDIIGPHDQTHAFRIDTAVGESESSFK